MGRYQTPEEILKTVGIYEPEDIDLELIAYSLNTEVEYYPLGNVEGQIIGTDERAIITINSNSAPARQRFSLGHELGHWVYDRGKNLSFSCSQIDMANFQKETIKNSREARANRFSAELLMPSFMLKRITTRQPVTIENARLLANRFCSSVTSAAIRLVESTEFPAMLICWDSKGSRCWFIRSETLPDDLFPHQHVARFSSIIHQCNGEDVDADQWIDTPNASDYTVKQSIFFNGFNHLVLLWWDDESPLTANM